MKHKPDFINICIACDDNYAPHGGALIASVMANKNEEDSPRFFVLSDKLSEGVKQQFHEMARQGNFPLSIVECTDDMFHGLPTWKGKYNAYFRLATHRLLPSDIAKALYLDCDTIATTSLAPLFNTDISDKYAAVVAMSKESDFTTHDSPYFSSGMILFNLERYRKDDLERKAVEMGNRRFSEIAFPDQDLLNEVFGGNVIFVPLKWHIVSFPAQYHRTAKVLGSPLAYSMEELQHANADPGIIHFNARPWRAFCEHPLRGLYWKYLRMTPFYREIVKKYYISWLSSLYQRYFRINLSKKNVHIKLFGVDVFSWKFSTKRTTEMTRENPIDNLN